MTQRKITWVIALFMFWLGYAAKENRVFPLTHFFKRQFLHQPEPIKTSAQLNYHVYTEINKKRRVDCPAPSNVEVVVAIGQSNAANTGGHRYQNDDPSILNFFGGQCYIANDPMLGANDIRGSMWVPFARAYKRDSPILLQTIAIGGTKVSQWLDPQDLGRHLDESLAQLATAGFTPDLFIWVQGESDVETKVSAYRDDLSQFVGRLKNQYPTSHVALSGTSYCRGQRSQKIVAAQRWVAKRNGAIWLGSIDEFDDPQFRYDDCHFSQEGLEKVAKQFVRILRP